MSTVCLVLFIHGSLEGAWVGCREHSRSPRHSFQNAMKRDINIYKDVYAHVVGQAFQPADSPSVLSERVERDGFIRKNLYVIVVFSSGTNMVPEVSAVRRSLCQASGGERWFWVWRQAQETAGPTLRGAAGSRMLQEGPRVLCGLAG